MIWAFLLFSCVFLAVAVRVSLKSKEGKDEKVPNKSNTD